MCAGLSKIPSLRDVSRSFVTFVPRNPLLGRLSPKPTCETRFFFQRFLMFVPSLSWQIRRHLYKSIQKGVIRTGPQVSRATMSSWSMYLLRRRNRCHTQIQIQGQIDEGFRHSYFTILCGIPRSKYLRKGRCSVLSGMTLCVHSTSMIGRICEHARWWSPRFEFPCVRPEPVLTNSHVLCDESEWQKHHRRYVFALAARRGTPRSTPSGSRTRLRPCHGRCAPAENDFSPQLVCSLLVCSSRACLGKMISFS